MSLLAASISLFANTDAGLPPSAAEVLDDAVDRNHLCFRRVHALADGLYSGRMWYPALAIPLTSGRCFTIMRIIKRRDVIRGGACLMLAGRYSPATAENGWPTRPVRFIVPLAAGGALDFAARQCSAPLSRILAQRVFVENDGAGGTIGMDAVMKATPDGYTFLFANDNAAIAPHILNLSYDYTREMLPVIAITQQPIAFAVNQSLGVKTVAELVNYVRKNPGLGFASSGVGSNQHVLGAWFAKEAEISLQHVPYRGAGQAVTDLVAGTVKFGILGPTALLPHVQTGALIIIAQTSEKRSGALPDVPTLVEAGYKNIVMDSLVRSLSLLQERRRR